MKVSNLVKFSTVFFLIILTGCVGAQKKPGYLVNNWKENTVTAENSINPILLGPVTRINQRNMTPMKGKEAIVKYKIRKSGGHYELSGRTDSVFHPVARDDIKISIEKIKYRNRFTMTHDTDFEIKAKIRKK